MACVQNARSEVSLGSRSIDIGEVEAQLKAMKWPEDHKYGTVCCCKDYIQGRVPMKYIQPEKPKSFKPTQQYHEPCESFPTDTVYKRSYEPIDACHVERRGAPPSSLTPCGPFAKDTTHRMSYGPVNQLDRTPRFYPHQHNLQPSGPMQDVTTQRHDFTPKTARLRRPFKFQENIGIPDTPMENRTTNRLSYQPIGCVERPRSYRPQAEPVSQDPFPKETVYRMSFQPSDPLPRILKCTPAPYEHPQIPMEGLTVYKRSFLPPGRYVKMDCPPAADPTQGCYCVYPGECMVEKYKKAHDFSSKNRRKERKEAAQNKRKETGGI